VDPDERALIVCELAASFTDATDVSPAVDQPLHVLLSSLMLPGGWCPSPTRALLRFIGWPEQRPELFVDDAVRNGSDQRPRNSSQQYVLGETWMQYSAQVPWPEDRRSATRAVQFWVARFREET